LVLVLLVYVVGRDVTSNCNAAATASLFTAFGGGLAASSVAFLGETLAAVLLLLVAWMLYRAATRQRPAIAGVVCGLALGLLTLTKAVYLYFIPILGIGALLALPFASWRIKATSGLIAALVAAAISGLWIHRNHSYFGSYAIAERDGNVMAIRAQFTTMTWQQYWAGYLAFTPKIGPKLIQLLGGDPKDAAMFDPRQPDGFIQRYRRGEGPVSLPKGGDQAEMRRQALTAFVENWPKQLALIPLSIYRSTFLPVGWSSLASNEKPTSLRILFRWHSCSDDTLHTTL
jgi:4-amino-4-deoxy-L-arabinose transferase-like glycosyltransferase